MGGKYGYPVEVARAIADMDRARADACVAACRDIPNPEAVPGLVEAVRGAPIASKYHGQNGLDPKFWDDYAEWSLRIADALRRCGVAP